MKKGFVVCLLMCLLFTSCSQSDHAGYNASSVVSENMDSSAESKMLLDWTSYDTDAYRTRTNNLLASQGYSIGLEIPRIEIKVGVNIRSEYRKILKETLAKPNFVAIVRHSDYQYLHSEGVLADIASTAESVCPEYYQKATTVPGGKELKDAIPAAADAYSVPSKIAVQIKREIREQYALPITNATEYESFLVWAKKTYSDLIPGNIPIKKNMLAFGGSIVDDLFLPEYGITPIDSLIGGIVSLCMYDNDTGKVYASEELQEYNQAYQRLWSWVKQRVGKSNITKCRRLGR